MRNVIFELPTSSEVNFPLIDDEREKAREMVGCSLPPRADRESE